TGVSRSERQLWQQHPEWAAVGCLLLVGTLGALALHPSASDHGVAHAAFFPSVVLLTALAWGLLSGASRFWRVLVRAGMLLEFTTMFWSHVWLARSPDLLDPFGINAWEKSRHQLVFLNDLLGNAQSAVVVVTVLVQLLIVGLLVRLLVSND